MKQKIKTIAIQLMYQKGYHACSISDIAKRAGIQKSSIYYHYMSKEEILFDILKETMESLNESLQNCLKDLEGAEERLVAMIRNHLSFHMVRQKEVIVSDSELRGLTADNLRSVIRMRDEYDTQMKDIIERGIQEGVFKNVNPRVMANAIVTMCTQISQWFNPLGSLSKDEIIESITTMVFNGLKRDG
ncbi:MAG: TetR/AcrR family transcriptional regulator [Syntrophales bacterium]|nr:TetR/AcrR family transcriptional regulator [Syntrophales bacterium]MCK9527365.1 TetR/AcrR family transcriptional regulator [Syntrophales bacterium]